MTPDSRHRRLLANRYQLVELVGSGAMGQVYRAEDKLLGGVTVAVKFLSQALLNNRMKERFEREATISALLGEKSIHIVRVRDYGLDEKEIPFYVMEFLQGESIGDLIKYRPLPVDRFLRIARQICYGLDCAHKGILYQGEMCPIVHRDIKPSNILLIQDAALGELVKILDFGIAKLVQSEESQTQAFMGTLAYCSPEQMEGKELDNRSDIYSMGIMMYEMLTGEMPLFPENSSFGGWYEVHHHTKPQPMPGKHRVPQNLEALIMKCMAKSPKQRPQNVDEVLKEIEKIEASLVAPPPVISAPQKSNRPSQDTDSEATVVSNFKPTPSSPRVLLAAEDLCKQMEWPADKPQQKIVFPHVLQAKEGNVASLWAMLDQEDIFTRMTSIRYNQFLLLTSPHPMILWITVLYHRDYGPRWLPCYLDLKTSSGQRFANLLGKLGHYWILFFAVENPQKCQQVLSATIAPNQCKLLQEWALNSQSMEGGKPQITKRLLKQEFEKLKPKIVAKLSAVNPTFNKEVSGL